LRFPTTEEAPFWISRFFRCPDRSIALDQFRRFVGHSASLEKLPANVHFRMSSVRRL